MTTGSFSRLLGVVAVLLAAAVGAQELEGRLEPGPVQVLGLPVSGVIEEVAIAPGDRVEAGQRLLALDGRVYRAELRRAEALLAEQEEVRAEARREWERARELFDRTVMSERDLQLAKNAMLAAEADYAEARAAQTRAAWELEMSVLKAPVAGRILALHAYPGQVVVSRDRAPALLELLPAGGWLVRAEPGSGYRVGETVRVRVGEADYAGRITRVRPAPDSSGAAQVVVGFSAADSTDLQPGMPARVRRP